MKRVVDVVAATRGHGAGRAADAGRGGRSSSSTSRGPVLYRQQRVGEHGQVFTLHKFRSMRTDAEAKTGRGVGERRTTTGSFPAAVHPAHRGSTSCRSCGTCCAAT